jgi:hypothetical protein
MKFINLVNKLIQENSIGLIEDIVIDGIGSFKAKTDTGNEAHNVIHGVNVKINGAEVEFKTDNGKTIKLPLKDTIKIHIGDGNVQDRPVVQCNCLMNGKRFKDILFSVSDRTENTYKVLLGAPFIKAAGGLVDVTKKD